MNTPAPLLPCLALLPYSLQCYTVPRCYLDTSLPRPAEIFQHCLPLPPNAYTSSAECHNHNNPHIFQIESSSMPLFLPLPILATHLCTLPTCVVYQLPVRHAVVHNTMHIFPTTYLIDSPNPKWHVLLVDSARQSGFAVALAAPAVLEILVYPCW